MIDPAKALHKFWSSFGLPAYDSGTVPSTATYPRLTYDVSEAELDAPVYMTASLWYHSLSWADITAKAEEIRREVGVGGHMEPYDNGAIWITRGEPFIQRMSDPDPDIRRIVLSINAEFLSND